MRIGIDIDDVITDTSLSMKEYINKYLAKSEGFLTKINIHNTLRSLTTTFRVTVFLKSSNP